MTTLPSSLVVATYNIRLGIQKGLGATADVLCEIASPDILAVQEIGMHWLMGPEGDSVAKLSRLLNLPHTAYAATIEESRDDGPPARYGHALLSRWPIDNSEIIELPRHSDEPRALLRCSLNLPFASIEVLSTHLSHRSSDRPTQGAFLERWLADHPQRTDLRFLLGDLNDTAQKPWLSSILSRWTDADKDQQRSTFPAHSPQRRIDYVLAKGTEPLSVTVPESPESKEASDHRPVISRWHLPDD